MPGHFRNVTLMKGAGLSPTTDAAAQSIAPLGAIARKDRRDQDCGVCAFRKVSTGATVNAAKQQRCPVHGVRPSTLSADRNGTGEQPFVSRDDLVATTGLPSDAAGACQTVESTRARHACLHGGRSADCQSRQVCAQLAPRCHPASAEIRCTVAPAYSPFLRWMQSRTVPNAA